MARTEKPGLTYFSHDVNINADPKMKYIRAKHGNEGKFIFMELLECIYSDKGYFLHLTEKFRIMFASENKIEIDVCNLIINDCIDECLFDINLYNDYSILTSKRIQLNYLDAIKRRKSVELISEFILTPKENYKNLNNVSINSINDSINYQNVSINSQSKVKYSKVNESIVNEIKPKESKVEEIIVAEKTPPSLQNTCKIYFESHYEDFKGVAYYYDGKSAGALKQIITKIKNAMKVKDASDDEIVKIFKYFIENINDEWVLDNYDLPNINSQFNKIISKIRNGSKTNQVSNGFVRGYDPRKDDWTAGAKSDIIQ